MPNMSPPPIDAAAAIASLRTLGTLATQAAAGNDSRFGATPAVAFGTIVASTPSSFNLSSEGTTDWLDSNGTTQASPYAANALTHRKVGGSDVMARSLVYFPGGAAGATVLAGTDSPFTKTTTAADDIAFSGALNAVTYTAVFSATAAVTGYGFRFDAPCKPTQQTLNLYVGVYRGTATISATLSDGTTVSTTLTNLTASTQRKVPILFTGGSRADLLRVMVTLTTNGGSSPNVQFYCATLA